MDNYEIATKFLIDEVERLLKEIEKQNFDWGVAQERSKTAEDELVKEAWKALQRQSIDVSLANHHRLLDTISKFCKDWKGKQ